ncbi:MAG: hypothetical protein JSV30_01450 [Candidatus Omnitrophota bacterium]|nr:MAG: hypothetical protein JSV30_01450 [Candidatus Omnitrophota bacterium]
MPNPFNPLDWLTAAQNWFARTEKSSGFRPYLILLILVFGLAMILLTFFNKEGEFTSFIILLISIPLGIFILLYIIKCFQDPNFCRSEKHIETVRRIELMQQKGESRPTIIKTEHIELISKPKHPSLPPSKGGAK